MAYNSSKFVDPVSGMVSDIYPPTPHPYIQPKKSKSKLAEAFNKLKTGVANKAAPAMKYMKANPWKSAGLGVTGAANLAGLFDNSKIGGQIGGLAAGGALGQFGLPLIMNNVSPQLKVLTALGGGTLGALFDRLRQKEDDQYQQALMYGGNY